jgi:hypothetical protein
MIVAVVGVVAVLYLECDVAHPAVRALLSGRNHVSFLEDPVDNLHCCCC